MEVSGQLHAPAALPPGKEPLASIGLKINSEETKYMIVSRHQNIEQYQNLLTVNKSF
jgi:hypothetical protein